MSILAELKRRKIIYKASRLVTFLFLVSNNMNDPMFGTPEFIEVQSRLGYDLSKF